MSSSVALPTSLSPEPATRPSAEPSTLKSVRLQEVVMELNLVQFYVSKPRHVHDNKISFLYSCCFSFVTLIVFVSFQMNHFEIAAVDYSVILQFLFLGM